MDISNAYFFLGICGILFYLSLLFEKPYLNKNRKGSIRNRVLFRRDKIINLSENIDTQFVSKIVSEIMERFLLFKRTPFGYWNNVSANLRFLAAAWVSSIVTGIVYLAPIKYSVEFDKIAFLFQVFGATFVVYYWNDRTAYYNKWSYLANLYNECLKANPFIPYTVEREKEKYFSYRNSLEHALAIDIIEMEMWSHRSFNDFLFEILKYDLRIEYEYLLKATDEIILGAICSMTKSEAIDLLTKYQEGYLGLEQHTYQLHTVARR